MLRAALLIVVLEACGRDKPPPDPICDAIMERFDQAMAAVNKLVENKVPHGSPAMYCAAIDSTVHAATGALFPTAGKELQTALVRLDAIAQKCVVNGIASTQTTVKKKLAELRTYVAEECAK